MSSFIENEFPLHYYIWNNEFKKLKDVLKKNQNLIEKQDVRGRTPLMLAVSLGHFECAKLLINFNANLNIDDDHGFNVLHEAIATNDPELVQLVLEKRNSQRASKKLKEIPIFLKKIIDTPDFYVEMKFEFTSWIPLVSTMCPSDVYKIYKSGSSVRVDTTLTNFEQMSWQRGSRTYIFSVSDDKAKFFDINHDNKQVYIDKMVLSDLTEPINNSADVIAQDRLTCPTSITYIDTDNIVFERSKSGIIGFRTDRTEFINGYECKVYTANNVQLVTKTRTEHLSEHDKQMHKEQMAINSMPFKTLFNTVEITEKKNYDPSVINSSNSSYNLSKITLEQYFDPSFNIKDHDIGRPREITTRINKFKTNLWISEKFPLSLQEQILPIIDLMAINSNHFAKLRDFITLQIPPGFPVRIEIPLFHIVTARITFGNIFGMSEPVKKVKLFKDENVTSCLIDESVFKIPINYSTIGNDDFYESQNDEDDYMGLIPQKNSLNNGLKTKDCPEKKKNEEKESDLQKAIEESLKTYQDKSLKISSNNNNLNTMDDYSLEKALKLSRIHQLEENERKQEEEDNFTKALKISLVEK